MRSVVCFDDWTVPFAGCASASMAVVRKLILGGDEVHQVKAISRHRVCIVKHRTTSLQVHLEDAFDQATTRSWGY